MKKLIYMCLAICMFTAIASAQKVTEKDLQGTWKMTNFSAGGLMVDVTASKITLKPELESQLTPEQKQQMEEQMDLAMEMFKESYAYFEGANLRQTMGGQEQKGTFTLKDLNGKQYIVLTVPQGGSEDMLVTFKDKKLTISQGEGDEAAEFVYMKQ